MSDSSLPTVSRAHYWKSSFRGLGLILSIILLVWGVFGNIRSEFIPAADQEKWRLPILFPHVPWYWLVIIFLVITLMAIFEGSFREHRKQTLSMSSESERLRLLLYAEQAKNAEPKLAGQIDCLDIDIGWDLEMFGVYGLNEMMTLKATIALRVSLWNESTTATTVSDFTLWLLWDGHEYQADRLPVEDYAVKRS